MAVSLKENKWFFITDQTPRIIEISFVLIFRPCYDDAIQKIDSEVKKITCGHSKVQNSWAYLGLVAFASGTEEHRFESRQGLQFPGETMAIVL
jgi:hypothetical protein